MRAPSERRPSLLKSSLGRESFLFRTTLLLARSGAASSPWFRRGTLKIRGPRELLLHLYRNLLSRRWRTASAATVPLWALSRVPQRFAVSNLGSCAVARHRKPPRFFATGAAKCKVVRNSLSPPLYRYSSFTGNFRGCPLLAVLSLRIVATCMLVACVLMRCPWDFDRKVSRMNRF